jgi:hypothetical protein
VLVLDLPSASVHSRENILEETNPKSNNLTMSKRSRKASKQRLANQSKGKLDPRAKPQPLPAPIPTPEHRFVDFIEHPLFLAGVSIVGAIVGVFLYSPVLLICEVCLLLALHRSKILRGRAKLYQASAYGIALLLTAPLLWGLDVLVKEPAREYLQQVTSGFRPQMKVPSGNVSATASSNSINSIPLPGGIFTSPALNRMAATAPTNVPTDQPSENQPPPNSIEAKLMREMRDRLTRDAGDPEKISGDVQWMRDQFEQGWAQEPPELARKHREETEQTARLILSAASNRAAVLQLVPHIMIDK